MKLSWYEYTLTILMPTSVHIPKSLLDKVDRRARRLRVSRNRFIVQTLERAIAQEGQWSPEFLAELHGVDALHAKAVDEMLENILAMRKSKAPPPL